MKKVKNFIAIILVLNGVMITNTIADPPDPPNPGNSPISNGDPVGAPIDGGIGFLLILGASYGTRKIFFIKKSLVK